MLCEGEWLDKRLKTQGRGSRHPQRVGLHPEGERNPWKSRTQIHVEVLTVEDVPACLEWLLVRASRFHEGTSEWEAQWVLLMPGATANSKILRSNLAIKQEATQKVGSTWRFNAMILMPTPAVAGHHILTPPLLIEHCISYFSHWCDKESQAMQWNHWFGSQSERVQSTMAEKVP